MHRGPRAGRTPAFLLVLTAATVAAGVAGWLLWQRWPPEPPTPGVSLVVDDPVVHIPRAGLVVRVAIQDEEDAVRTVEALQRGGVTAVALQSPARAMPPAVARARATFARRVLIGVAGVHTSEGAREAVRAGAEFVLMPSVDPEAIQVCQDAGVLAIPGAFTATEIGQAWNLRTGLVALFPAGGVDPAYLRDLLREMPGITLVAAGGLTPETAGAFIRAGAAAVVLTDAPEGGEARDSDATTHRAQSLVATIHRARLGLSQPTPPRRPVEGPDIK